MSGKTKPEPNPLAMQSGDVIIPNAGMAMPQFTDEERKAYEWALSQTIRFPARGERYAKVLAKYIKDAIILNQ